MPPTALALVPTSETISQRIARLQREAREGALQEAAEVTFEIQTLVTRAQALVAADTHGAVPDGIKQLLNQFAGQATSSAGSLEAILRRVAAERRPSNGL